MLRACTTLALALLAGCGGGVHKGSRAVDDTDITPPATSDGFATLAEGAGYTVASGEFRFVTFSGCCEPDADCKLNNPSTPYGTWILPPGPGQTAEDVDPFLDLDVPVPGMSRAFRLRADEAVVWLGKVPPQSRYVSFRSYVALRREAGTEYHVLGSLGPSINQEVLAEAMGTAAIHGQTLALVTTMDGAVRDEVHALLERSGVEHIVHDPIPPHLIRHGLDAEDDSLAVFLRFALTDDQEAADAYVADPGARVWRLSPTEPRALTRPHPEIPIAPRGTGETEAHLLEALDALEDAVRAHYDDGAIVQETKAAEFETYRCLDDLICAGEISDRHWASSRSLRLTGEHAYAVVLGVNHRKVGKAVYSNFAVDNLANTMGVVAVDDRDFDGSAELFLPDHPDADKLFAWVVARDCDDHPGVGCYELPTTCPGADFTDTLRISTRAYLEPATGVGPDPSELLPERVLRFYPRGG